LGDMLTTDRQDLDTALGAMHTGNFHIALPILERLAKAYPERANLGQWQLKCQQQLGLLKGEISPPIPNSNFTNFTSLPPSSQNSGSSQPPMTPTTLSTQNNYPPSRVVPNQPHSFQSAGSTFPGQPQPGNLQNYDHILSQTGSWQNINNTNNPVFQNYSAPLAPQPNQFSNNQSATPNNFYQTTPGGGQTGPTFYGQGSYSATKNSRPIENLSLLQLLIGLAGCCFIIAAFLPQAIVNDSFRCNGAFEMGNRLPSAPCGPWISQGGGFYTQNSIFPYSRTSTMGGLNDAVSIITMLSGVTIIIGMVLTIFKIKLKVGLHHIDSFWIALVGILIAGAATLYRFLNLPNINNPVEWDYPKHGYDGSVIGQGYNSGVYETTSIPQPGLFLAGGAIIIIILILLISWRAGHNHRIP